MVREVILYTRRGCGLCDEAATELRTLQSELGFSLREVDIDGDADLRSRFNDVIPVIAFGGRVLAEAPIATGSVRDVLAAALD